MEGMGGVGKTRKDGAGNEGGKAVGGGVGQEVGRRGGKLVEVSHGAEGQRCLPQLF